MGTYSEFIEEYSKLRNSDNDKLNELYKKLRAKFQYNVDKIKQNHPGYIIRALDFGLGVTFDATLCMISPSIPIPFSTPIICTLSAVHCATSIYKQWLYFMTDGKISHFENIIRCIDLELDLSNSSISKTTQDNIKAEYRQKSCSSVINSILKDSNWNYK